MVTCGTLLVVLQKHAFSKRRSKACHVLAVGLNRGWLCWAAGSGGGGFKWWYGVIIAVVVAAALGLMVIGFLMWRHRRLRRNNRGIDVQIKVCHWNSTVPAVPHSRYLRVHALHAVPRAQPQTSF